MNRKKLYIAVTSALGLLVLCTSMCGRKYQDVTLSKDTKRVISITPSTVSDSDTHNVTSSRGADVTVKTDGKIVVIPRTYGWSLVPFVSGTFDLEPTLNVGCELAFYRRLSIGLQLPVYKARVALGAVILYQLPYDRLSNVHVLAGYDTRQHVLVGLAVRLGQ